MATPRSLLVDSNLAVYYHLMSRCVRRSWLCGRDPRTGRNFNHRKAWLKKRLFHLAKFFPIEVQAYTILDNHFHLVVYYDPIECQRWDDNELVYRWTEAFPPRTKTENPAEIEDRKQLQREALLGQAARLQQIRRTLGSLSSFMKHLKQPFAWRANREDKCTGHFFEGRFYSGALLSEEAVLATMAYVDLNPVRAKIAKNIRACHDSSIFERLQAFASTPERLREALKPLVSGINATVAKVAMTLGDYIAHLDTLTNPDNADSDDGQALWFRRVAAIRKRHRAYGGKGDLKDWFAHRKWHGAATAFPE